MNNNIIVEKIDSLTEMQKEAVIWNEGPVMVLAGPGSGKTAVLTLRIARLLDESSEDNYRILGLTFTNKAAEEMKTRIEQTIEGMEKRLFLGTFHSFCTEVLRNHGSYVDIKPDFTIYSNENDLKEIVKDVINSIDKEGIVDIENFKNISFLPIIQYLQRNLILPGDDLDDIVKDKQLKEVIGVVYQRYFNLLKELNVLDFDSLILYTYILFSKYSFIANHYRTMYSYICVDEFQDTNNAQYNLIRNLTGNKFKNLFLVADDDQIIYQWNGASHKRISEFIKDYDAEIIQLNSNFRCPKLVVSLANNLIKYNTSRAKGKKPLLAMKQNNEEDDVVIVKKFFSIDEEIGWIANDINEAKAKKHQTIAIIARNNRTLTKVYEELRNKLIDVVMVKRKSEFESSMISWLHLVLKLANKRSDEKILNETICKFERFTGYRCESDKIIAWSKSSNDDYLKGYYNSIIEKINNHKFLKSFQMDLVERNDFINFIDNCFEWFDSVCNENDGEYAEYLEEKQILKKIINDMFEKIDKDELTLSAFLQELELVSKEKEPSPLCVQCTTIHSSKGKEFDRVYLIGLVEDELPSYQSIKNGGDSIEMEEERRNCFVAITRTKETLILTYSEYYYGWRKQPSRFLHEMGIMDIEC